MYSLLLYFVFLVFWLITACSASDSKINVTNLSDLDIKDALIVIKREFLANKISLPTNALPTVLFNNVLLTSQLDDLDEDGVWDELIFLIDLDAKKSKQVEISFVEPSQYPTFEKRTNIRLGILDNNAINDTDSVSFSKNELPVPLLSTFQMDGIAWENDKVGFRQYFDGRNAIDIFGKILPDMALDPVGISSDNKLVDNYHVMEAWGRDILAVGNSLGFGGIGLKVNNKPYRLGVRLDAPTNNIDLTSFKRITEGPVRAIFKTTYEGWTIENKQFTLHKLTTIKAGAFGYENKVWLESDSNENTLLVGLVNIHNNQPEKLLEKNQHTIFYTHDLQTYNKEWYLGMGLIFPTSQFIGYENAPLTDTDITNTYLVSLNLEANTPLTYHSLFGWEQRDESFSNRKYFESLLVNEAQHFTISVEIN